MLCLVSRALIPKESITSAMITCILSARIVLKPALIVENDIAEYAMEKNARNVQSNDIAYFFSLKTRESSIWTEERFTSFGKGGKGLALWIVAIVS